MDKMREGFEAWCNSIKFDLMVNELTGNYEINHGFEMWLSWQASRAALCVDISSMVFSKDRNGNGGLILHERALKAMDDAGVPYK